ncbi:transposase, partial [Allorhizobium ampelinum]
YQPALRLTQVVDSQSDESVNQWRPASKGRGDGTSDRLAGRF